MVERVNEVLAFWLMGIAVGYCTATWFPSKEIYPLSTIITISILLFIVQMGMFFKLWVTR